MQKMNIIPQILFEILKFKKSSTLTSGENSGFLPEIQIFPRHAVFTMGHHFFEKIMLPALKSQLFCLRCQFISFTELSRQQIQISQIRYCLFLVYMANVLMEKRKENPPS